MKAITKTEIPNTIRTVEKSIPSLDEGEVLIEVAYCGVCGSDLHAVNHSKGYEYVTTETTLGHEISGKVVEVNNVQNKVLLNQNVIVESMHYCGHCENCLSGRYSICINNQVIGLHFDGGMAPYVKTKEKYVRPIFDHLPLNIASLMEPMSIAYHAINKLPNLQKGEKVLVQGPGIIGFLIGLLCADKQADVFISGLEKDYEYRLSKAEQFSMEPVVIDQQNFQEPVDYIFECSGSTAALHQGIKNLKKGGKIVLVALYGQHTSLFLTDFVRNEWPLITSYGCDPNDYQQSLNYLIKYQNQLQEIITSYSLKQASEAFEASQAQQVLKAVIHTSSPVE